MQRLILVRHAETQVSGPRVLRGPEGDAAPISEVGQRQAEACAGAVAALDLPAPRLYSSPARRSVLTAQALAARLGLAVQVEAGLREMDVGDWAGRPHADLHGDLRGLTAPDGRPGFPGGESWAGVGQRMARVVSQVLAEGGTPLLVSHGLALHVLQAALLAADVLDAWDSRRFLLGNAAFCEVVRAGPNSPWGLSPKYVEVHL